MRRFSESNYIPDDTFCEMYFRDVIGDDSYEVDKDETFIPFPDNEHDNESLYMAVEEIDKLKNSDAYYEIYDNGKLIKRYSELDFKLIQKSFP